MIEEKELLNTDEVKALLTRLRLSEGFMAVETYRLCAAGGNAVIGDYSEASGLEDEIVAAYDRVFRLFVECNKALKWLDAVLDFGNQEDGSYFSDVTEEEKAEAFAFAYEVVCGRIPGGQR